jgi:hypothetical protein
MVACVYDLTAVEMAGVEGGVSEIVITKDTDSACLLSSFQWGVGRGMSK